MNQMLLGAVAMACLVASLFFLRYWKTTRDRFFLFFAVAFASEALSRIMLGAIQYTSEQEPLIYLLQLAAFLIILYAIIDKNWLRGKPKD